MKETRRFLYLLTCVSSLTWIACGSEPTVDEGEEMSVDSTAEESAPEEGKVVYYGTPSLVEVASIMKASGASFTNEVLNGTSKATGYSTQFDKAINVGVYGADLTYSAMFDETQESINYLKTIKGMADDLGMMGAFESELLSNIESNINNRDSLLDVITDFYWSADAYLMDNERTDVASLIVTGGWVESMYIACHMAKNSPKNKEIKQRIAEQKLILKNLILFLKSASGGQEGVAEVLKRLNNLKALYENINITTGNTTSETNVKDGETVIDSGTEVTITDEQLDKLCTGFTELRNNFVK